MDGLRKNVFMLAKAPREQVYELRDGYRERNSSSRKALYIISVPIVIGILLYAADFKADLTLRVKNLEEKYQAYDVSLYSTIARQVDRYLGGEEFENIVTKKSIYVVSEKVIVQAQQVAEMQKKILDEQNMLYAEIKRLGLLDCNYSAHIKKKGTFKFFRDVMLNNDLKRYSYIPNNFFIRLNLAYDFGISKIKLEEMMKKKSLIVVSSGINRDISVLAWLVGLYERKDEPEIIGQLSQTVVERLEMNPAYGTYPNVEIMITVPD